MKVSQSHLTTGPISLHNSRSPSCGLFFGTCWTRWPKGFFNVEHLFSPPTHLHLMFSSVLSTSGTSGDILLVDRRHTCQSQSMWPRQLIGLYLQSHMGKIHTSARAQRRWYYAKCRHAFHNILTAAKTVYFFTVPWVDFSFRIVSHFSHPNGKKTLEPEAFLCFLSSWAK